MAGRVRIIDGLKAIERLLEEYRRMIYRYNSIIAEKGFYLKPVHIVVREVDGVKRRYVYIGRYWWRVSYAGKKGRISRVKWVYVGREKPRELIGYPDPPPHPLVGLSYIVEGNDVIMDANTFKRYKWVFEGYKVVPEE